MKHYFLTLFFILILPHTGFSQCLWTVQPTDFVIDYDMDPEDDRSEMSIQVKMHRLHFPWSRMSLQPVTTFFNDDKIGTIHPIRFSHYEDPSFDIRYKAGESLRLILHIEDHDGLYRGDNFYCEQQVHPSDLQWDEISPNQWQAHEFFQCSQSTGQSVHVGILFTTNKGGCDSIPPFHSTSPESGLWQWIWQSSSSDNPSE